MRIKLLFILALLCTVMQGAWAQNDMYCTASDVGRVVCTDGNIYDNVSAATAAGSHAVAKIIWVDEKNKKGLALNLWDEGYANRTDGIERCNNKNTSGPVAGAAWKLATKDEWDTMIDAAGGQQNLANGFSSVGGNNLNTSYGYYATSSVTSYAPNRQYYVYKFGSYSGWTDSKNDLACLVRPCLTFNLLTLYTINNQNDWFNFCDKVNGGDTFSDKYVKITCNDHWLPIVSEMAGTDETHSFQGVFDGNGHTITFNVTVTATEDYCAPFRHVKNAVIKNLHVDGSIYTSQKFAAGFVGESHGALSITNSRSSINITGSRSGDGTYGGFVATLSGADNTITIDGCVFDGSFATTNGTTNCGGFIGWPVYNRPTISNSLMKPSSVDAGMLVNTFARWHTTYQPTITNCYYVATDNLPTNQGTQAYVVNTALATLGNHVQDYSMVKAYQNGILYDGKYYVGLASISLADNSNNTTTISEANGSVADVTLADRTLYKDGKWNTICLPFDVVLEGSALEGATARPLTAASISGTTLNLTFGDAVTTLTAGTPYIIKWESGVNIENPVFYGVTIDKTDRSYDNGQSGDIRVRFLGTYKSTAFDSENKSILLMGGENTLYYPTSGAGIGAQRAYFKIGSDAALARRLTSFSIDFGDEGTLTGITDRNYDNDNNFCPENAWYSLDGRMLDGKPTRAGLYINNGNIVVIKQ